MRMGGATSQLYLPSLTPLSVAGCGRLQLAVPFYATSVDYCKQLIIDPTFCGSRFPIGRLLAIKDFIPLLYSSVATYISYSYFHKSHPYINFIGVTILRLHTLVTTVIFVRVTITFYWLQFFSYILQLLQLHSAELQLHFILVTVLLLYTLVIAVIFVGVTV